MKQQLNSAIFIDLFTEIEQKLREICDDRYHAGFTELVRKARAFHPAIQRYANDLREFAELRNAITHTRRENFVIAEPHDDIIKEIRKIRNMLNNPPRLNSLPMNKPYYTTPTTPVMDMLKTFAEKGFVRCPVVDKDRVVCLITAKTLAKWLTETIVTNTNIEKALVSSLIPFTNIRDFAIVPANVDILTVYNMFKRSMKDGNYIQSILITENGSAASPLVGLFTPSDLPKIVELMDMD
ncbi:CBS domain-containing protein [Williamwhitmania taraxaci]|uniref:CBS domain-containing protein n=1 Tax=Williamwhitmania taraxaci TaxID=1640674 RepID=A0A1G6GII8_9BACT|nr:CBS domain-containing protein [Williamwhitmania taraxaci]SDB81729.1 CBS domain-containing protein [Williamwhitmania taraxaci]